MKTKKIYIIRHGQTDYNQRSIVQGRGINSSLNELGQSQANAFYNHYKSVGFDIIYISTLKRTAESVTPFLEKGVPHIKLEGLDEISWGVYEGKEANYEEKAFFKELTSKWASGETSLALEEGESPEDVANRQQFVIEKIKNAKEDKILICMHGRALRVFLTQLLKLPIASMDQFEHSNLGLYVLEYADNTFSLLAKNKVDHLQNIN